MKRLLFAVLAAVALALAAPAQAPASGDHAQHHDMEERGNQGMGFAQNKTTHHFFLRKDGGAIQVTANSTDDNAGIEHIRMHLEHIRSAFQAGDFNIPGFVHDQTPPGVPVMVKLKDQIRYKYEEIAQGGRVTISSQNADAIAAVQRFLRFQIDEHKTGDSLMVK